MKRLLVAANFERQLALFAKLVTIFVDRQLHRLPELRSSLNSNLHLRLCYCLLTGIVDLAVVITATMGGLVGVRRLLIRDAIISSW